MATPGKMNLSIFNLLVILSLTTATWNTNDYLKREHSLVKPFQGAGMNIPLWDFLGTTMVTSNYIRLTPDRQSTQGAIWNSVPCRVKNWELHVQFKVHGSGKSLFGDGFVHQHPYISAMVNNGTMNYDHDRDGTHTELAGCSSLFRNKDYDTYLAIRYEGSTSKLKVSMDIDGKNGWTECFTVDGVRLPLGYYFGVSAATGQLADNHDIMSLKLYELDVPETEGDKPFTGLPEADFFASPRDHVEDPKGGFMSGGGGGGWSGIKIFFVILLVIIGIIVCGAVAYVIFNRDDPSKRKRFY
ncbi:LMAN2-like protein [Mya arenaria]|uniref:LMAN2-like protein n=1 Tax=Mya arenaria TaxID=6604 RepID=A0ABY7FIL1_MYAAR|nr:LMAN2-like protein [Mya arenaria]